MVLEGQIIEELINRYQKKDIDSRLNKKEFQALFRAAVKDYYPKLKEQYKNQSIYGISFEIGNVVQKIYKEDFEVYLYSNTEEQYQENIKDCSEEEKDYYRFEPFAEWDVITVESGLFEKVQEYLEKNSLYICSFLPDYIDRLEVEDIAAATWYDENGMEFEDKFNLECKQIRIWMAEVLGELRKEGFWKEQGNEGLYVIPFSGEDDIGTEELITTYLLMDMGCHGTEYVDYLKSCDQE